jgi:hypothetical protein
MRRRLFSGASTDTASSLNNLGFVLYRRKAYAEAETYFQEALDMQRRLISGDHADLAAAMDNLAAAMIGRGDDAGAEPLQLEALEMRRRLAPGGHPDIVLSLHNLGARLRLRGEPERAEPYARDALEMADKVLPPDHPTLPTIAIGLARIRVRPRRPRRAEKLLLERRGRSGGGRLRERARGSPRGLGEGRAGKGHAEQAAAWRAKAHQEYRDRVIRAAERGARTSVPHEVTHERGLPSDLPHRPDVHGSRPEGGSGTVARARRKPRPRALRRPRGRGTARPRGDVQGLVRRSRGNVRPLPRLEGAAELPGDVSVSRRSPSASRRSSSIRTSSRRATATPSPSIGEAWSRTYTLAPIRSSRPLRFDHVRGEGDLVVRYAVETDLGKSALRTRASGSTTSSAPSATGRATAIDARGASAACTVELATGLDRDPRARDRSSPAPRCPSSSIP